MNTRGKKGEKTIFLVDQHMSKHNGMLLVETLKCFVLYIGSLGCTVNTLEM